MTMFEKTRPLKFLWDPMHGLCLFSSIITRLSHGPICKVTKTETMKDWMAVIRWEENGGINGIHSITNFDVRHEATKLEGLVPTRLALQDIIISIEESASNPVEHTFYLGQAYDSPVLEIFPRYLIKQHSQDGTLRRLLSNFGIKPHVTEIYSKL